MDYANTYSRVVVITFGAAAAALLLYLIFLNATTDYQLGASTMLLLGSIILGTLGIDIYAVDMPGASITVETNPDENGDGDDKST